MCLFCPLIKFYLNNFLNLINLAQQQQQCHQPELLFTSCSSISSPSSPISLTLSSPAIITQHQQQQQQSSGNMTSVNANANSGMGSKRGRLLIRQQRVKKDGDLTGDLETPEAGIYAEYLLSVPSSSTGAKMERHASEPSPATSSGLISTPSSVSGNLLSVPTHSSYLVKQHSHPLLPSQQPSTSYMLTRQYSQPIQTLASHSSQIITSSSVHTHEAQDIAASGQLLQFHHQKQPPVRSHTMPHYSVTDMEFGETTKVSSANVTSSPTVVIIPDMTNDPAHHHTTAQSHVITQQTIYQKSSSHHLQLPSIRVKSEELQRSISSPLVRFFLLF